MMIPIQPISDGRPRTGLALAGLSLSMLMPSLATSAANVALPTLAQAFAVSFQAAQWIVLTYLVVITSLIVAVGRLGDMIGRRRLLLTGIALFTLASLLCAMASAYWVLIAARAAQGLGAAIMMALTIAFVGDTVPRDRVGSAMGLLGTMSAIGTTLGPSLGGLLIMSFGWRAIFAINLPLGIVAFMLACRSLPADASSKTAVRQDFDGAGMALLLVTLGTYALAMTLTHGHVTIRTLCLLVIALAAGAMFLTVESRAASPLIDVRLLRNPLFGGGLAANLLVSTVMMATLVVGPFYLSQTLELDPVMSGVAMSTGPLVAALTGIPAGRVVDLWGNRLTGRAGLAIMLVASLLLGLMPTRSGYLGYVLPTMLLTAGYAAFQAANTTAIMAGAPAAQRGLMSGMLNVSRNLGLVTGASAMGAIFAIGTGAADIVTASATEIAAGMRNTFLAASILITIALAIRARAWG